MNHQRIVEQLLIPAWRGIPADYKTKYARNIWDQFGDQIKSAAYTSSLRRFFEVLTRALDIQVRHEDVAGCEALLSSREDRLLLKILRDETLTLVLMVRLANDERRQATKGELLARADLDRQLRPGESPLYRESELDAMKGAE